MMSKTHRRHPFKIGGKNWLKRNIKTNSIAFFKKTKNKNKDIVKSNILLCFDTIAIKSLSPKNE